MKSLGPTVVPGERSRHPSFIKEISWLLKIRVPPELIIIWQAFQPLNSMGERRDPALLAHNNISQHHERRKVSVILSGIPRPPGRVSPSSPPELYVTHTSEAYQTSYCTASCIRCSGQVHKWSRCLGLSKVTMNDHQRKNQCFRRSCPYVLSQYIRSWVFPKGVFPFPGNPLHLKLFPNDS